MSELIAKLMRTAADAYSNDTLVSMAEGACNEQIAIELNHWADRLDEQPDKVVLNLELDKLFVGAPIMGDYAGEWILRSYYTKTRDVFITRDVGAPDKQFHRIRLPNLEEAPRNTWLVPWIEIPEELENLRYITTNTEGEEIIHDKGWQCADSYWNTNVVAIMIMGEFQK